MARSFILSFSRPTRKGSQDSQQTNSYQASESLWSNPGGKAEAVLGPFEPKTEKRKKLSRKERKSHKHPSTMSITVSDRGSSRQEEVDSGPITNTQSIQRLSPMNRPQSTNDDAPDWDNKTDVSGLQAHRSQSSSTLRSYYDPAKSPLYISQQTSASSARDMALRKGQPQIISPKRHDFSSGTTVVSGMDDEFDSKRDSMGKSLHVDLSTLFPKPSTSNHTLLSLNSVVRSPSVLSVASSNQQSIHSRPRWFSWERKKSKESISSEFAGQTLASVDESIQFCAKKTTKNAKRASQTWFDGLEDEENASIDIPQDRLLNYRSGKYYRSSLKAGRDIYSSDQTQKWGQSHQNPKPYLDSALARRDGSHSRRSRTSSNGSQKSVRWETDDRIKVLKDNFQNHSFLILTSSDDEIEDNRLNRATYSRHRIRASIEKLDNGDDVIVCSAERVKQIKPRPVVNIPHRKTPRFKKPEVIPPVPLVPILRPEPSPRVSSIKWREEMKDISPSIDLMISPAHSRQSSCASHSASRVSSSPLLENTAVRGSKLMAVTEDEEKLLEGMRRKRASLLRKNHIANKKGSLTSSQNEGTSLPRPKTAGETLLPRSSYFEPDEPTSPQANGQVRFLATSAYAASADDLSREESFSSSDTPSSVGSSTSDAKRSSNAMTPNLGSTPPDIPPNISPSHNSPLTPPPEHNGCLDIYGAGVADPHSPPAPCPNKGKHDRKKTLSSGIVVLDGAEQHAQALDEENEIAGWAMDRW